MSLLWVRAWLGGRVSICLGSRVKQQWLIPQPLFRIVAKLATVPEGLIWLTLGTRSKLLRV